MAGISPIPTTRTTGLYTRDRLLQQLQSDQLSLLRIQDQISTGRRINLPSEDAPAALRSITLQQLLERKSQIETNVTTGSTYLAATDTALSDVSTRLADIRGSALGVAGTTATDTQRQAVIDEIDAALDFILSKGNTTFRGRYLFGGTNTSESPYELTGQTVTYHGNESLIQSYSDLDVLFSANIPGTEVFGGISEAVAGSVDLNPQVTEDTLLSTLQGGAGLSPNGAISVSDGSNVSVIDLSGAVTVGDVARLIEENPPQGKQVQVDITGQGLTLRLPPSFGPNAGANLSVSEVGSGRTALELGILNETGVGTGDLVGDDLNPSITLNTRLEDLLGTKARAEVGSVGQNNDFSLIAASNGASLSGVTLQYVDDELLTAASGLAAGNEVAEYDANARAASAALSFTGSGNDLIITADNAGTLFNNVAINVVDAGDIGDAATATYTDTGTTRTLTIGIDDSGETSVQAIIDELANNGAVPFTAAHDNSVEAALNPTATVAVGDAVTNPPSNTGNSGGAAGTLYVRVDPGASTANQVIAAINDEGTFTAELDPQDSSSLAAAGSGIVDTGVTAVTSGGSGANLDLASGIQVVNGGETYTIETADAETVQDLLNVLNGSPAGLSASLNDAATGVDIRSRVSGAEFQIGENGGSTATQLGVRTYTSNTRLDELNEGVGVPLNQPLPFVITGDEVAIETASGQSFAVTLPPGPPDPSTNDVINAINAVTGVAVTAQDDGSGGIELIDNTVGIGTLQVESTGTQFATAYEGSIRAVDFSITDRNGQGYNISLASAETIEDVLTEITSATGGAVVATLASVGNGITLTDTTGGVAGDLTVSQPLDSTVAQSLGFLSEDEGSVTSTTATLTSEDRNFIENESVFNTLLRLQEALESGDTEAISRAIEGLDADIERVTFARAEVGARQQGLELTLYSLEDETIQLTSALSEELDVDLAEAISDLTARQTAYQASLQTIANLLQLSLLDFL
ncbi:MAG: flagellin [Planctomycetota bacterium]